MKAAWIIAAISSVVATVASILAERSEIPSALADVIFLASFILGTVLVVGISARYRTTLGKFFEGTNRYRIHVLTVGDIALILLLLQIFSAGLALSLMTAVIFTHNIYKSYDHELRFLSFEEQTTQPMPTPA